MASDTNEEDRLGFSNEIGSLRTVSHGSSHFVGSSSGVFFVNTVRRAFINSAPSNTLDRTDSLSRGTSPELFIGGNDDSKSAEEVGPRTATGSPREVDELPIATRNLYQLPTYDIARMLVMTYFKCWHPLFPVLHGPSFMREFDALYLDNDDLFSEQQRARRITTLRCIFGIACLEYPNISALPELGFKSPANLMSVLAPLALQNDVDAIQALLIAQLYLFATMSLQAASSVGGLLWKSIFNTGLHRCPYRYEKISALDRLMRKRVFWSAYSLDRFLSQALGHPLGIQDSDIDVCPPGQRDLHEPVRHQGESTPGDPPDDTVLHLPNGHPAKVTQGQSESSDQSSLQHESHSMAARNCETNDEELLPNHGIAQKRQDIQLAQGHFVLYGKLTGRALEIFHKSITVRSANSHKVLSLRTDINKWWNDLPPALGGLHSRDYYDWKDEEGREYDLAALFAVLYDNLTLLVHRPALSLEPSKAEFQASLQICIRSARNIITTLHMHLSDRASLFWPGYLSSAWMAGLIIAFACQLKTYNKSKGLRDIGTCLEILDKLSKRWPLGKQCHSALEQLVFGLKTRQQLPGSQLSSRKRTLSSKAFDDATSRDSSGGSETTPKAKRTRNSEDPNHEEVSAPWTCPDPSLNANTNYDHGSSALSEDGTGVFDSMGGSFENNILQQSSFDEINQAADFPGQIFDGLELLDLFVDGGNDMFNSITWESLNNNINSKQF